MKTQTTFAARAKRIVAKYPNHKNSKLDHEEMMEELAGLQKEQQAAKELRDGNQPNQLAKGGYTDANLFAEGTENTPKASLTLTAEDTAAIERLMKYKQAQVGRSKAKRDDPDHSAAMTDILAAGPFAKDTNVKRLLKKVAASNLSTEDKGQLQEVATFYQDKKNLNSLPDSTRQFFERGEAQNATADDPLAMGPISEDLITLSTDEEAAVVQTIQQTAEEDESVSFLEPSTKISDYPTPERTDGPRATPITPEVAPFEPRTNIPTADNLTGAPRIPEYSGLLDELNKPNPHAITAPESPEYVPEFDEEVLGKEKLPKNNTNKNKFDSWWMAPTLASGVAPILTNLANRKNVGNAERVDPTPYTPSIKPTWYDNQPIKDALSDSLASSRYALTERGGNSADYLTALRTLNQDNMRQLGLAEVEGQKMNQQEQARIDQLVSGSKKYNAGMETQADNDKYGTQLTMDQLKRDYLTGASDAASGVFADTSDAMLAEKLGKLKGYYTTLNSQVTTT